MIKKILVFTFIISIAVFAQDKEKQNPNVELPDFVITGKDVVNVQKSKKIEPDVIPTISQEFLKPVFSPEELHVKEISNPVKEEVNLLDTLHYVTGNIEAGLGLYSIPRGKFTYHHPYNGGIFSANASVDNRRAHVENSGRFSMNGGLAISYFVDTENGILGGTKLKAGGNYGVKSYKFYAAPVNNPAKRTMNSGSAEFDIKNMEHKSFLFALKGVYNNTMLQNENYSENLFNINGLLKFQLANFSLGSTFKMENQALKNNISPNNSYNFLAVRPTIGLKLSKLRAEFGFNYSKQDTNNYFSPYAAVGIKLDKSISLFAEYSPQGEFVTNTDLLNQNEYYNPQTVTNLFVKKEGNLKAVVKYEYQKYFEIDGGFHYTSMPNMPYFIENLLTGEFSVNSADARTFKGFVNLLFHLGPYGVFYGSAEFDDTRDTTNNFVPYNPNSKAYLAYGYNFKNGFDARATLYFIGKSYADFANNISINPYIDLGLNLSYTFEKGYYLTLDFSNLMNHKNYRWFRYQDFPFDITAGLTYRW